MMFILLFKTHVQFVRQHMHPPCRLQKFGCALSNKYTAAGLSSNFGPVLQDPNTGVAMFETPDIIEYLEKTYAV